MPSGVVAWGIRSAGEGRITNEVPSLNLSYFNTTTRLITWSGRRVVCRTRRWAFKTPRMPRVDRHPRGPHTPIVALRTR